MILQTLQGEMSRGELMEKLRLKDRIHFGKDYLQPALAAGLIEMIIPDKPRSSKQKYRLTDKGRQVLQRSIQARQSWLSDLADTLSDPEKENIIAALKILIDKANHLPRPVESGKGSVPGGH